jgi:hypothetical protein
MNPCTRGSNYWTRQDILYPLEPSGGISTQLKFRPQGKSFPPFPAWANKTTTHIGMLYRHTPYLQPIGYQQPRPNAVGALIVIDKALTIAVKILYVSF